MKITRPIKVNRITQNFGESLACVLRGVISRKPCKNGAVDFYKSIRLIYHNGIDLAAYYKEPGYHSGDFEGWMRVEKDVRGGIGTDIVSKEPILKCTEPNCNETHYIKLRYWHNSAILFKGKKIKATREIKRLGTVKPGDKILLCGSSGASTGVHIHFGVKWCDKDGNALHANNGLYGAFDPSPYYENKFIGKTTLLDRVLSFIFNLL